MVQLLQAMDADVSPRAPVDPATYLALLAFPLVVENVRMAREKLEAARQVS